LPVELRDDRKDPHATRDAVARIVAERRSDEWLQQFAGKDVCCNVVRTLDEAMTDPQFLARGLFRRSVVGGDEALPAVSVPIDEAFRSPASELRYPKLGESNGLLAPGSNDTSKKE
jgi:crotonobetainyl-CoA:carnitine CoA-transferase CaiB-like acyl-CoA transferase